jgi:hypothetical protein
MSRFFSVRCALLGFPRHRFITKEIRYTITNQIISELLSPQSVKQLDSFNHKWADKINKELDSAGNNKKQRKNIIRTESHRYYEKYNEEFLYALVLETLPLGEASRKQQGLPPLDLTTGIYLRKRNSRGRGGLTPPPTAHVLFATAAPSLAFANEAWPLAPSLDAAGQGRAAAGSSKSETLK